jgi:hypothetical protein
MKACVVHSFQRQSVVAKLIALEDQRRERGESIETFAAFLGIASAKSESMFQGTHVTDATRHQIAVRLSVEPHEIAEFGAWLTVAELMRSLDSQIERAGEHSWYKVDLGPARIDAEPH